MAGGSARRSSGLGLVADLKVRTTLADLKVRTALAACLLWMLAFIWPSAGDTAIAQASPPPTSGAVSFQTASECMACHNSLTTSGGEDVSIGVSWRASMMAHSSRDPYWLAAVRRETIDHPKHAAAIEDECSICHMPMTTYPARAAGRLGRVFDHLASRDRGGVPNAFAADGVSCTVCHQITAERLGTPESFTGGYVLNVTQPRQAALMFGPFQMDEGRSHVMRSATGVEPAEGLHVRQSELCATCHTLFTQPLDGDGRALGRLPEQVPFLEWQHSAYRTSLICRRWRSRRRLRRSSGNYVGIEPPHLPGRELLHAADAEPLSTGSRRDRAFSELEASASATERQLQRNTATVTITEAAKTASNTTFTVVVENLTGHKLPTGYPSRRAWLHVTVRDRFGRFAFESGATAPTGAIAGNDHDADGIRYEPHYEEIRSTDQVQIYESVMVDGQGAPCGMPRTIGCCRGASTRRRRPPTWPSTAEPSPMLRRRWRSCAVCADPAGPSATLDDPGRAAIPDDRLPVGAEPRRLRCRRNERFLDLLRSDGEGIVAGDRPGIGDHRRDIRRVPFRRRASVARTVGASLSATSRGSPVSVVPIWLVT